jgi:hypothetical protein
MDKQTYYHLLITGQLEEGLIEPNDFEFIRMMKEQEENRQNGRRRKNNRNYPRGKRKAL